MKLIIHIFIVVIFLCCSGCMTGLVIESATKGEAKQDKIRFNRAYWRDDNLFFHIDGSLAEGINKQYTIKQEKEWAADSSSQYYTIKRSSISPGLYLPQANWVEINIFKTETEDWDPPLQGPKCYLVQDCKYDECAPTINYYCPNKLGLSKFSLRKSFHLQPEYGFPPLYKLLLLPIALPADIITFPFQLMFMRAGRNVQ